jgi:hypothetical protein
LTNAQGNHGEDVKELYYYLDATPSHSYLKILYKYPQLAFPYSELIEENSIDCRQTNRYLVTHILDRSFRVGYFPRSAQSMEMPVADIYRGILKMAFMRQ